MPFEYNAKIHTHYDQGQTFWKPRWSLTQECLTKWQKRCTCYKVKRLNNKHKRIDCRQIFSGEIKEIEFSWISSNNLKDCKLTQGMI